MKQELLTKLTSFMSAMKTDDQSAIVSGLQDVVAYLAEKVAICEEIVEEKTGNKKLHLSDDSHRRVSNAA